MILILRISIMIYLARIYLNMMTCQKLFLMPLIIVLLSVMIISHRINNKIKLFKLNLWIKLDLGNGGSLKIIIESLYNLRGSLNPGLLGSCKKNFNSIPWWQFRTKLSFPCRHYKLTNSKNTWWRSWMERTKSQ